jgi:hypothetical protein
VHTGLLDLDHLRQRLGIPADARRVMVLSESSHWDPNWVRTSEEYFDQRVGRTLDLALDALDGDARRVWSAESVFFLAMYWDRRPAQRDRLVGHLNSGQMRLTSASVTTPDTLLPTTESVIRDFLIGQEWLRRRGIVQEPDIAYFPDCFGHSAAMPSLLQSVGTRRVLFGRLDGAHLSGMDRLPRRRYPLAGSSAAQLLAAGSADFVWRDQHGAEILAHWQPYGYGQADRLDTVASFRRGRFELRVPGRWSARVGRYLERQAARLEGLAPTPFLLCPIGHDFCHPKPDLLDLLDRYNEHRYPATGLWVLNAGADDYLDLVEAHLAASDAELPVVPMDPNPYWTGFYASRPNLKLMHRRLVDDLLAVEAATVASNVCGHVDGHGDGGGGGDDLRGLNDKLSWPWWAAAVGNHHDFITGTSPDRVVAAEQLPMLTEALDLVPSTGDPATRPEVSTLNPTSTSTSTSTLTSATATASTLTTASTLKTASTLATATATHQPAATIQISWADGTLQIDTGAMHATFDAAAGGCATRLVVAGTPLPGPVGDLVAYEDGGGLWRLGSEFVGGRFRVRDRASNRRGVLTLHEHDDGSVSVQSDAELDGLPTSRTFTFRPAETTVVVRVRSSAGRHRTVTLVAPSAEAPTSLWMDTPGGTVERPRQRMFTPTLWPAGSWVSLGGAAPSLTVALDMSRGVTVDGEGRCEVIVARNAIRERSWGILPLGAFPAAGHEPGVTEATVALHWAAGGDEPDLARLRAALGREAWTRRDAAVATVLRCDAVDGTTGAPDIISLKPAHRGEGLIVRLGHPPAPGSRYRLRSAVRLSGAARCDGRERDLEQLDLGADGTTIDVELTGITTLRLLTDAGPSAPMA